ncbi:MAG: hypothetical protein ABIA04_10425 [Pseudomonadota bacterium]
MFFIINLALFVDRRLILLHVFQHHESGQIIAYEIRIDNFNWIFKKIMPHKPRYLLIEDGSTFHCFWQFHNKDYFFSSAWAKNLYYKLLLIYKDTYDVTFYNYDFMDNHFHSTGTCSDRDLLSAFYHRVHTIFANAYNKKHNRFGQVFRDRFKTIAIERDKDLLKVMHYIDLNPKRATKVSHPKQNRFSSFHYYAYGKKDPLITPAPAYLKLGKAAKLRQRKYRQMIEILLKSDWNNKMPYSSNLFIGSDEWIECKTKKLKKVMRHANRTINWSSNRTQKWSTYQSKNNKILKEAKIKYL